MPRWPAGLHRSAGSQRNTGGRPWRPLVAPQHTFGTPMRAPIGNGTGQVIVNGAGTAIVVVGPSGIGTRWYPSQIQVATTSGASDGSTCTLYRGGIDSKLRIGQTLQGGGDTLAGTAEMQPGDLIYAVWTGATPGDLATVTIFGDQVVLA